MTDLARATALLDAIAEASRPLTVSELATRTQVPPSDVCTSQLDPAPPRTANLAQERKRGELGLLRTLRFGVEVSLPVRLSW
jgi:hypothetical protein